MDLEKEIVISVIIPVSRVPEFRILLDSLSRQDFDPDKMEVIAVSSGQELSYGFKVPFNLSILSSGNKTHLSVKRNIGCAKAGGRYLAFLDDDCLIPQGWISSGVKLLKKYAVVCGPCREAGATFTMRLSRALTNSFMGNGATTFCNYNEEEVPFYHIPLCNVFMHADVWKLTGGFNENANYLMDDKEFFYLQALKGLHMYNSPAIELFHKSRSFPLKYLKNRWKEKLNTGANFFVYHEMFRRQPVFYLIYSSFILFPVLLVYSWKLTLALAAVYSAASVFVFLPYLWKDPLIYLLLPGSAIITEAVMLAGIFAGSMRFLLHKEKFKEEITAKKVRIEQVLKGSIEHYPGPGSI